MGMFFKDEATEDQERAMECSQPRLTYQDAINSVAAAIKSQLPEWLLTEERTEGHWIKVRFYGKDMHHDMGYIINYVTDDTSPAGKLPMLLNLYRMVIEQGDLSKEK